MKVYYEINGRWIEGDTPLSTPKDRQRADRRKGDRRTGERRAKGKGERQMICMPIPQGTTIHCHCGRIYAAYHDGMVLHDITDGLLGYQCERWALNPHEYKRLFFANKDAMEQKQEANRLGEKAGPLSGVIECGCADPDICVHFKFY